MTDCKWQTAPPCDWTDEKGSHLDYLHKRLAELNALLSLQGIRAIEPEIVNRIYKAEVPRQQETPGPNYVCNADECYCKKGGGIHIPPPTEEMVAQAARYLAIVPLSVEPPKADTAPQRERA